MSSGKNYFMKDFLLSKVTLWKTSSDMSSCKKTFALKLPSTNLIGISLCRLWLFLHLKINFSKTLTILFETFLFMKTFVQQHFYSGYRVCNNIFPKWMFPQQICSLWYLFTNFCSRRALCSGILFRKSTFVPEFCSGRTLFLIYMFETFFVHENICATAFLFSQNACFLKQIYLKLWVLNEYK